MTDWQDKLYDALSNRQRRQLLFALLENALVTDSLNELDTPPDGDRDTRTARIEYRHVHLPKLDDRDFIDWCPDVSCVERGPRFDEIEPTLELLAAHHDGLSIIE